MLPQLVKFSILAGVILLFSSMVSAQSIFDQFGVKQYGNSHSEPFYYASDIYQDSLKRLVFKYSSKFRHYDHIMEYDGNQFVKKTPLGRGQFLIHDTLHNVKWYKPDLFTAVAYRGDSIFSEIHTDDFFNLNFHFVYLQNEKTFLLTNSGVLEYKWTNNQLNYKRSIPFDSPAGRVEDLEVIGDTLFCDTAEGMMYKLYNNTDVQHRVRGMEDISRIQLPGGRLLRQDRSYDRVLNVNSWLGNLIRENHHYSRTYLEDSKGRFWIYNSNGENKGLNLYEKKANTGRIIDLGVSENLEVRDIYEDHEGSIWIGTKGEGLLQIYEKTIQILDSNNGLKGDNVSSIQQGEDGTIYISEFCNGVTLIQPDYSMGSLGGNQCVNSVVEQSDGSLWLNTYGIIKYEGQKPIKQFRRKEGLHSRTIKSVFNDSRGVLWVGTRQAIHSFDGEKFIPYVNDSISFFNRLFNIVELEPDRFLLAFVEGEIMTFSNGNYERVVSSTYKVSHLHKDSEGRVWVATEGDGLHRYIDGKVEPISDRSVFSSDISFLQEDDLGNLWSISEDNSIRSVNKNALWNNEEVTVKKYTIADGLPLIHSNCRIQPAAKLLQDGKIIFPNVHGAIVIDPTKSKRVKKSYNSVITYKDSTYTMEQTIRLPVGVNNIFFSFTNVTLHPENHFEYEYSFSDDNWNAISDHTAVNITNIPYGSNTLNIRSRYADENWNNSSIALVSPPPFYYKWWFLLSILLLFSAFITFLVKWRTGIVKRQNAILEEKVKKQTEEILNEKTQLAQSLESQRLLTHELNISQVSKNRMYAQISHEFKSPLQAINSFLNSSSDHLSKDDKDRITGNIKQLLNTSSEIMDLSKAESGALKAKKNFYNINNIIREQIILKTSLADEKLISIEFIVESEKVYIKCDISLMQKVIGNLLSNAIKFSSTNSNIIVKSISKGESQYISVEDKGVGIPSGDIENLTLAYFQASNNNEEGTGIGLSLVERILDLHDSDLHIESKLGEGSTFGFLIAKPDIANHEIETIYFDIVDIKTQLNRLINPKKQTILAVDDSVDILHFVRKTLESKYNVITTTSGVNAINNLDEIAPSLILSDANMPIMSGNELLKEVRNNPTFENVPFLILTGSLSEETELSGIRSGADFVLQKPIEVDLLRSQIGQILNRQIKLLDEAKESFIHELLPVHMLDDDRQVMMQMEQFILDNLDRKKLLSVDIAHALGLGEKTLRNRVKKISGFTIKEYLKNFRLEKAKLLIEQDYGTKGEVANAVGFSSLSYFSKSYKKYFASKEV